MENKLTYYGDFGHVNGPRSCSPLSPAPQWVRFAILLLFGPKADKLIGAVNSSHFHAFLRNERSVVSKGANADQRRCEKFIASIIIFPRTAQRGCRRLGDKSSARFPFYPLPRSRYSPWPRITGNVRVLPRPFSLVKSADIVRIRMAAIAGALGGAPSMRGSDHRAPRRAPLRVIIICNYSGH